MLRLNAEGGPYLKGRVGGRLAECTDALGLCQGRTAHGTPAVRSDPGLLSNISLRVRDELEPTYLIDEKSTKVYTCIKSEG